MYIFELIYITFEVVIRPIETNCNPIWWVDFGDGSHWLAWDQLYGFPLDIDMSLMSW